MRQWLRNVVERIAKADPEFIENSRRSRQKRIDKRLNGWTRPFIIDDLFIVSQFVFLIGMASWLLFNTNVPTMPVWPLWVIIGVSSALIVFYLSVIWFTWRKLIKQKDAELHKLIDQL